MLVWKTFKAEHSSESRYFEITFRNAGAKKTHFENSHNKPTVEAINLGLTIFSLFFFFFSTFHRLYLLLSFFYLS